MLITVVHETKIIKCFTAEVRTGWKLGTKKLFLFFIAATINSYQPVPPTLFSVDKKAAGRVVDLWLDFALSQLMSDASSHSRCTLLCRRLYHHHHSSTHTVTWKPYFRKTHISHPSPPTILLSNNGRPLGGFFQKKKEKKRTLHSKTRNVHQWRCQWLQQKSRDRYCTVPKAKTSVWHSTLM